MNASDNALMYRAEQVQDMRRKLLDLEDDLSHMEEILRERDEELEELRKERNRWYETASEYIEKHNRLSRTMRAFSYLLKEVDHET